MKVEIHIGSKYEMRINTRLKNLLTHYTKSDILTKRLVLLHVDWDKSGLLFTKRLHIMNKFHFHTFTFTGLLFIHSMKHYQQYLTLWCTSSKCLYVIFEKLNLRLRMRLENSAKLFGQFGVRDSIPTG